MKRVITKWHLVVIAAAVLAGGLSLWLSRGQSIWFDENYSILLARHSFHDLLALTAVDAHPPFYYVLLKLWAGLFGWSEVALRSLSALCLAGAVAGMLVLVRRLFSMRVAVIIAPLLVLAPFLLRYGYEVRMYALVGLIGVMATWVLVRARESQGKKWWVYYGLLVTLGMYTVYLSAAIWAAHLVWVLLTPRAGKSRFDKRYVWAVAGAVLLFVPYLPIFLQQMEHSALPGIGSPLTLTKLASVLGLTFVYMPDWELGGWTSLALVVFSVLFGLLFAAAWIKRANRKGLLLLGVMAVVPIAFFALTSLPPRQPIFVERYIAHVVVYVYALTAVVIPLGWMAGRRRIAIAAGALLSVFLVVGVAQLHMVGNFNLERLQHPMTASLRDKITCNVDTSVVADDPYTYIDSEYYFGGCNLLFYSADDIAFQGGYAPLHNSDKRVSDPSAIMTNDLVHLRWQGADPSFKPNGAYRLVHTYVLDKQIVDVYER